jgi:hypothetical protein
LRSCAPRLFGVSPLHLLRGNAALQSRHLLLELQALPLCGRLLALLPLQELECLLALERPLLLRADLALGYLPLAHDA